MAASSLSRSAAQPLLLVLCLALMPELAAFSLSATQLLRQPLSRSAAQPLSRSAANPLRIKASAEPRFIEKLDFPMTTEKSDFWRWVRTVHGAWDGGQQSFEVEGTELKAQPYNWFRLRTDFPEDDKETGRWEVTVEPKGMNVVIPMESSEDDSSPFIKGDMIRATFPGMFMRAQTTVARPVAYVEIGFFKTDDEPGLRKTHVLTYKEGKLTQIDVIFQTRESLNPEDIVGMGSEETGKALLADKIPVSRSEIQAWKQWSCETEVLTYTESTSECRADLHKAIDKILSPGEGCVSDFNQNEVSFSAFLSGVDPASHEGSCVFACKTGEKTAEIVEMHMNDSKWSSVIAYHLRG